MYTSSIFLSIKLEMNYFTYRDIELDIETSRPFFVSIEIAYINFLLLSIVFKIFDNSANLN